MQWLSAALGATVNTVTGNIANTGAMVAQTATQWNILKEAPQKALNSVMETEVLTGNMTGEEFLTYLKILKSLGQNDDIQQMIDNIKSGEIGTASQTDGQHITTKNVITYGERDWLDHDLMAKAARKVGVEFQYNEDKSPTGNISNLISILNKKYPANSNEFNWRKSLLYNLTGAYVDNIGTIIENQSKKSNKGENQIIKEIKGTASPLLSGWGSKILLIASLGEDFGQYNEGELMKAMAIDIAVNYASGKLGGAVTGIRTMLLHPILYMTTSGSIGVASDYVSDIAKNTFAVSDSQKETENKK